MVPLLVPLFVSAFRRAGDLAMAMESRCYHGGEGRTRLRVLKLTRQDWIACAVTVLFIGLMILESRLIY
jgi:energy-coupling factor transport system permease protein